VWSIWKQRNKATYANEDNVVANIVSKANWTYRSNLQALHSQDILIQKVSYKEHLIGSSFPHMDSMEVNVDASIKMPNSRAACKGVFCDGSGCSLLSFT
jgi:Ser-tRNA(Ala) deacylase AlaX